MTVDLHVHSTYSDGTLTPAQLVDIASKCKIKAISITDHDTIEGTKEAVERGHEKSIEVIPGIEFSCMHGSDHMHLLGYYINAADRQLTEMLASIQRAREERNEKIICKLNNLGVDISIDEVRHKSSVGQTGRPHIAQVLMEKKIISSIDNGFSRFLKKGDLHMLVEKYLMHSQQFR